MSRSTDAVTADLLALMPTGWAWTRRPGSILLGLVGIIAAAIARIEAEVDALREEIDPSRAARLLDAFERVLGPDACGSAEASASLGTRRSEASFRWTFKGGATPVWFVSLAAKFGVAIRIEEYRPVVCGDELGASPLIGSPEQAVWTVHLDPVWVRPAILGDQACGDFLGEIGTSPIECVIRRFAPAHTVPVFDYTGA